MFVENYEYNKEPRCIDGELVELPKNDFGNIILGC